MHLCGSVNGHAAMSLLGRLTFFNFLSIFIGLNGCQYEYLVSPDDRRGMALSGNGDFPF